MSTYLQIQIPNACHENWDKMDETSHGKFCNACQKNVIDFTLMSDKDLVDFFKKNKENVCGRLSEQQLNSEFLIPSKKIPWLRYFFQIAIPAFLFSAKTNAQVGKIDLTSKHIVDKKKVKSQFAIQETELKCVSDRIEPKISGLKTNERQIKFYAGAVSKIEVTKIRSLISIQQIFKPAVSNQFSIFPNPITSYSRLNIKWEKAISANQDIEIYNEAGSLFQKQRIIINKITNEQDFKLNQLPAGIYILKITDSKSGKSSSQQFIVE